MHGLGPCCVRCKLHVRAEENEVDFVARHEEPDGIENAFGEPSSQQGLERVVGEDCVGDTKRKGQKAIVMKHHTGKQLGESTLEQNYNIKIKIEKYWKSPSRETRLTK